MIDVTSIFYLWTYILFRPYKTHFDSNQLSLQGLILPRTLGIEQPCFLYYKYPWCIIDLGVLLLPVRFDNLDIKFVFLFSIFETFSNLVFET